MQNEIRPLCKLKTKNSIWIVTQATGQNENITQSTYHTDINAIYNGINRSSQKMKMIYDTIEYW